MSTAALANAATYYVATDGSDSNAGTLQAPFRTIGHGVGKLASGDTLYVRGGTYNESVVIWGKTGTSSAPIYIMNYSGETPVIDGTGTTGNGVVAIGGGSTYIRFNGFEVTNGPKHGVFVYNASNIKIRWNEVHHNQSRGISVTSSSSSPIGTTHHVLIEGNDVHHNVLENDTGTASSWQQGVSAFRAAYVDIIDNYVHENYGEGVSYITSDNGTIAENTVYDNFSMNIYLDNAQYTKVDRNYVITGWSTAASSFYRSGRPAHGIGAANETYSEQNPLTDLTITNNIVVRCHQGFTYGNYEYGGGLHNTIIANNTFVLANDLLLYIQNGSTNVHDTTTVANNVFYAKSGKNYAYATSPAIVYLTNNWYNGNSGTHKSGSGDVLADPLLADANGWDKIDFQLTASSPAIDAGTTEPAVTTDFWGTARAGVYDIGAHEY